MEIGMYLLLFIYAHVHPCVILSQKQQQQWDMQINCDEDIRRMLVGWLDGWLLQQLRLVVGSFRALEPKSRVFTGH